MVTITNAVITAYCACRICCGPHATGLAANGRPPQEGVTVAAPRWVPLGTVVTIRLLPLQGTVKGAASEAEFTRPKRAKQVPVSTTWKAPLSTSTLVRTAQDRTARRYDGRFDIYFSRHSDAVKFGIRHAVVTLQSPKPATK